MALTTPARPVVRRRTPPVVALVVVAGLVTLGVLGYGALPSAVREPLSLLGVDGRLGVGEGDGVLPDGTTVFDDELPGVAGLDADLLAALRDATTAAAEDGVEIDVNSGWRSPEYQQQLLDDAVAEHGSQAEAARWVATPSTSPHVSGDAVDVGGVGAAGWLAAHGAAYDLCRVYANEPWHFELRPGAAAAGCPAAYADPTQDPRLG